jgi:hypothetical protein
VEEIQESLVEDSLQKGKTIECGAALEVLNHFFLDCSIYLEARTTLIGHLNMATTYYTLDIKGVRRPG